MEVVPCLARSWAFDDSSLTYRFVLREDVMFTTGKRMTATDVVVSLERLRDPRYFLWRLDFGCGGARHCGRQRQHRGHSIEQVLSTISRVADHGSNVWTAKRFRNQIRT